MMRRRSMNRAVFKKLLQRKTLLWTAGGLAAAWLLAWYAVPWLVPLPEGLLHPEERGAVVLDRDGGRIATLPGPDYYHTEPVRRFRTCFLRLRWRRKTNAFSATEGRISWRWPAPRRRMPQAGRLCPERPPSPSSSPRMPILPHAGTCGPRPGSFSRPGAWR